MPRRKHLIIGCGSAGLSALEQIRRLNSADEVKVVTMEDYPPYSPTMLPYLLSGKIDEAHLPMRDEAYFDRMKAAFARNRMVTRVLPDTSQVVYQDGEKEHYDTLLIASGSEAVRPAITGLAESGTPGFHTIADCRRLLSELRDKSDIAVLGAGLIGMEIAAALVAKGCRVTIIEREPRLLPLYLDPEAESLVRSIFLSHGVRILTGRKATGVSRKGGKTEIGFSPGEPVVTDMLAACVGVKARTAPVIDCGIALNQGILVDRGMRTGIENIYAAGDVAESAGFFAGKPGMNPIIPSAVEQGDIAGSNMAGEAAEYEGWISTNVFHFFGNTAFSAGMPAGDNRQVFMEKDGKKAQFKQLVYEGDRLAGAAFVNIDVDPGVILYLIRNRTDIGPHRQQLFEQTREMSRRLMQQAERAGGKAG